MSDYHFWTHHVINASLLAKAIYALLAFLSVLSWAIVVQKAYLLRQNSLGAKNFRELFKKGRRNPLALYRHLLINQGRIISPLTAIFTAGCEELQSQLERSGSPTTGNPSSGDQKITTHQFGSISKAVEAVQDTYFLTLEHLLIYLATTVSVAPFLGLLGTVWGILEAFQAMGRQGSTGVSAFGPGISEALVSTVAGLIVAIPALLGYNFIGARIRELDGETSRFVAELLALIEKTFVRE